MWQFTFNAIMHSFSKAQNSLFILVLFEIVQNPKLDYDYIKLEAFTDTIGHTDVGL